MFTCSDWRMNPAGDWELIRNGKRYRIEQIGVYHWQGFFLYAKPLRDSPDAEYLGAFASLEKAMWEVGRLAKTAT